MSLALLPIRGQSAIQLFTHIDETSAHLFDRHRYLLRSKVRLTHCDMRRSVLGTDTQKWHYSKCREDHLIEPYLAPRHLGSAFR
jgi:hypothetical protein